MHIFIFLRRRVGSLGPLSFRRYACPTGTAYRVGAATTESLPPADVQHHCAITLCEKPGTVRCTVRCSHTRSAARTGSLLLATLVSAVSGIIR